MLQTRSGQLFLGKSLDIHTCEVLTSLISHYGYSFLCRYTADLCMYNVAHLKHLLYLDIQCPDQRKLLVDVNEQRIGFYGL
jgi:hypothetical protein